VVAAGSRVGGSEATSVSHLMPFKHAEKKEVVLCTRLKKAECFLIECVHALDLYLMHMWRRVNNMRRCEGVV